MRPGTGGKSFRERLGGAAGLTPPGARPIFPGPGSLRGPDPFHSSQDQQLDQPAPAAEAAHPHGARRAGLFFLAFASGFAVLTIEIAGARLIAPVFGLSVVPWTAVYAAVARNGLADPRSP